MRETKPSHVPPPMPCNGEILIEPAGDPPFAMIPHTILDDPRLSLKAKGALAYLLGKPSAWKTRVTDIQNRSRDGRDSVLSALKELRKVGYAQLEVNRDGKGKITGSTWRIARTPRFKPPQTAFPDTDNPPISKKESSNNHSEGKKRERSPAQRAAWAKYSRFKDYTQDDPELLNYAHFGLDPVPGKKPTFQQLKKRQAHDSEAN